MYVLEKLWRDGLTPGEKIMRRGGKYHKLMKTLCEVETELNSELTATESHLFHTYQEIQTELQLIENREHFIEAFRLGAQIMLDIVCDYQGEFQDPTDD